MKLTHTKIIKKTIQTFEIHPQLKGINLKVVHDDNLLTSTIFTGKGPHDSLPIYMKSGFNEFIKKHSPWESVGGKYGIEEYRYPIISLYKDWKNSGLSVKSIDLDNFFFYYTSGNLLFNYKNEIVPTIYKFDYISTPFTNEYCDLEKLLIYLKKHPWVINGVDLFIDDVPYYNNDSRKLKYIRGKSQSYISILPDSKSINEIYNRSLSSKYFSIRMKELILGDNPHNWDKTTEKDWLGIRQFYSPMKRDEE